MKHFATFVLALALSICASAQRPIYLLPEYQKAHITFLNQTETEVVLNFDALRQEVYYRQGESLMQLSNMETIWKIEVDGRLFIYRDNKLCEVLERPNGNQVLVNWKFKNVNLGSKGALGATTQSKVEVMWTSSLNNPIDDNGKDPHLEGGAYAMQVWETKNDNSYFIDLDGKTCWAKRLKDLYKTYPEYSKELKAYVKETNLTMLNANDAILVIDKLYDISKAR